MMITLQNSSTWRNLFDANLFDSDCVAVRLRVGLLVIFHGLTASMNLKPREEICVKHEKRFFFLSLLSFHSSFLVVVASGRPKELTKLFGFIIKNNLQGYNVDSPSNGRLYCGSLLMGFLT